MSEALSEAKRLAEEGNDRDALARLKVAAGESDFDAVSGALELATLIHARSDGRTQRRANQVMLAAGYKRDVLRNADFDLSVVINFEAIDQASVALAPVRPTPAARVQREAETLLFSLYAARQIANLGDGDDIAESLSGTLLLMGTPAGLANLLEVGPGDVRVDTTGFINFRRGFQAKLTHANEISRFQTMPELLNRVRFKLEAKGFPPSGEGFNFFAPTSVLILLYTLVRRRSNDPDFLARLGFACSAIGASGSEGGITVINQLLPAAAATVEAWRADDPTELFAPSMLHTDPTEPLLDGGDGRGETDAAIRIARERYARGEITREEFKQIQSDLRGL